MNGRAAYIGYGVHWGLREIRRNVALSIVTGCVFARSFRQGGGLYDTDVNKRKEIDEHVKEIFGDIGRKSGNPEARLEPILNLSVTFENIFLLSSLSTGSDRILYHGDDAHTPSYLSMSIGQKFLGNHFSSLPANILNECKDTVNTLFPELQQFGEDEDNPAEERMEILYLLFFLIDMLASVKTDSKLLVINNPSLAVASKRLSKDKYSLLTSFINSFDRRELPAASPNPKTTLQDFAEIRFFDSAEFNAYREACDYIDKTKVKDGEGLRLISSSLIELQKMYNDFVDKNTTNLAIAKGVEKLSSLATWGISDHAKDFMEIVVSHCKEHQRDLSYCHQDKLESYVQEIAMNLVFGPRISSGEIEKPQSFMQRLFSGRLWRS